MTDTSTYTIEIHGRIDPDDLTALCPPGFKILRADDAGLAFCITADQSALIGLLRALHARGVVFEGIVRS